MRHRRTLVQGRALSVAIALTAVVSVGACSSDTASDTTVTTAAVASTAAPVPSPAGSEPSAAGADASAPVSTIADNGSDETLSPGASSECQELYAKFNSLVNITSGALPSEQEIDDGFGATRAFVPDDLKPDVDVFRAAYEKLAAAVAASGGDVTKAVSDPGVQQALQDISTPEVNAASQRVGDYLQKECPTG